MNETLWHEVQLFVTIGISDALKITCELIFGEGVKPLTLDRIF